MAKSSDPFRWFDSSPEVIRLVVMMYVRCPLSLRNVEDLLFERGIDICHETVRLWWTRFGPMFAADIRRKRVHHMRAYTHWRWHLDEVYVRINCEMRYLWRAVDHEGEVLESFVTALSTQMSIAVFWAEIRDPRGRKTQQNLRPLRRDAQVKGSKNICLDSALARDPQVESVLVGRRRELGLSPGAMPGRTLVQDLARSLSLGRGLGR